jgi:hypothetical protein
MRYQDDLDKLDADAIDELHKSYAHDLKAALLRIDIEAVVHWDRSPWGVRIGLVDGQYRDATYEQPSLFVLTESRKMIGPYWAQEWTLSLGNFGEEGQTSFDDIFSTIYERPQFGETPDTIASTISEYVFLLKHGAAKAHTQMTEDEKKDREHG